jgi:hypothetical protein
MSITHPNQQMADSKQMKSFHLRGKALPADVVSGGILTFLALKDLVTCAEVSKSTAAQTRHVSLPEVRVRNNTAAALRSSLVRGLRRLKHLHLEPGTINCSGNEHKRQVGTTSGDQKQATQSSNNQTQPSADALAVSAACTDYQRLQETQPDALAIIAANSSSLTSIHAARVGYFFSGSCLFHRNVFGGCCADQKMAVSVLSLTTSTKAHNARLGGAFGR